MTVRARPWLLGLAIALALADSSVVTLALPDILGQFDVSITTVAWVLTSYNLALAICAVPASYVARRRPRLVFGVGAVTFAAASLACGLATSFDLLVGARCVQAAGGALLVVSALALLSETLGSDARAAHVWVTAGVLGAALGPAVGGILTQALGWEAIFLVQVPLAVALLVALRGLVAHPLPAPAGRPHLSANAALLLLSGGLVAALFLIVLLLVNGWGMSPATAGIAVTVMPLAAIGAARWAPRSASLGVRTAAGIVLVAGGLTASPSCLVRAGPGRSLRNSSSGPESGSRSWRSRSGRSPAGPIRSCTAAGPSPRATRGSCSGCSCSRRC